MPEEAAVKYEFENHMVGNAIPPEFYAAIEKVRRVEGLAAELLWRAVSMLHQAWRASALLFHVCPAAPAFAAMRSC